jgi:integrase
MSAAFSLHRRKNSPYWFVSFRTPDPNKPGEAIQRTRSTKQVKKSEAERAARAIVETTLTAEKADTATGREIAAIVAEAAVKAEANKLNLAVGRELIRKMLIAVGAGVLHSYTVREWMNAWLAGKTEETAKPGKSAKGYSPATYARYSANVKQFLAMIPEGKAETDLSLLTSEDVRQFRDTLRADGRTAATVNDAVKAIRTALNAARREGLVVVNVAEAVTMLAEAETIRKTFAAEDVRRIVEASEGDWRGVILFGFFTGASLTDITNLHWRQIDIEAGTMTYARKKSDVPVVMPLHPELAAWLLAQPSADDGEAFLFSTLAGMRAGGRTGLSSQFNALVEKAGIDGGEEAPEGKAGYTRRALSFHSLRHSFNSALANAGVSTEIRQALAGHSSAAMNENYTHREVSLLRAAVDLLPGLPKAEGPKGKSRTMKRKTRP